VIAVEQEVARLFASIRRDDPSGVIDQFHSLAAANQYRGLYSLTAKYVATGAEVLDWGCGRGHFSYWLLKQGFRVTAYSLEHQPEIFAALSPAETGRLSFIRGSEQTADPLPFPDQRFAAAFSVGVLEHVRELGGDEVASLRELQRVVASEGVFISYHFPNRYSYIEALSRALHGPWRARAKEGFKFHKYRYTQRAIRSLCSEAGLVPVELRRYGFVPRNSFNRLPKRLRESQALASVVNLVDVALERVFSPVVQNYYFVARRGPTPAKPSRHGVS
jgi:ubiquinone/menaquinone biosynthesis C-methylase UbiE